jgi:HK97 gp10 family phage protein
MGEGLTSFQRRMKAIPEAVRNGVAPALLKGGEAVADTIRGLAPDDPATNAPDLKTSIAVTGPGQSTPPYSQPGGEMIVAENAVAVTAGGSDVRYPHLVEYGTRKNQAKPFFWPGFRLSRKRALGIIKRGIGAAIRGAK